MYRKPFALLLFLQLPVCGMSRINCTLVSDDFYRENARHLFSKPFSFTSMSNKNSVAMSSRLLGQRVNSRQAVRLQKQDGTTVWKYFDASYVFSKAGKVIKITY